MNDRSADDASSGPPRRRRLLVVEDDVSTSTAIRLLFGKRGWDVTVASDLAQAFALLDTRPDWLILDLMLPDGDGERVLEALRASGSPTRVVVTTGVFDAQRLQAVSRLAPTHCSASRSTSASCCG